MCNELWWRWTSTSETDDPCYWSQVHRLHDPWELRNYLWQVNICSTLLISPSLLFPTLILFLYDFYGCKFLFNIFKFLMFYRPNGTKYDKASEWKIPVVNVQWLSDLVLGHLEALKLPLNPKYRVLGQENQFNLDLSKVFHLMGKWEL